ncbi:MAG: lipoate--protein ligase family protein [Luteolibacter sp.]
MVHKEVIAEWRVGGYSGSVIFGEMLLWVDAVRRPGPEAMAVDEWLLETAELPVLRVYGWLGEWASVGYFGEIAGARAAFPGVDLVRRWTGGGMVDHRADWTYTIVAPSGEPLAGWRGAESYRRIHAALAETLTSGGIEVRVSGGGEETGAALCFENPVHHDLLGAGGRKLAGAGQRRSRLGLLHQGSVALGGGDEMGSRGRAEVLAGKIARRWRHFEFLPDPQDLAGRVAGRYGNVKWTGRR